MPTVYSATSTQWPLLQSKTEQKFKSGLFNVSAEFIRPVGNTELPTAIETSIGPVNVWPDPTVSSGTDGFERINATGYGVWDDNISEVTYNYSADTLWVTWVDDGTRIKLLPVVFENIHIRKIGDGIPPIPERDPVQEGDPPVTLRILSTTGEDITNKIFKIANFDAAMNPTNYEDSWQSRFETTITKVIRPTMVKKNTYGAVEETEVTYEFINKGLALDSTLLDFGIFYKKEPPQ